MSISTKGFSEMYRKKSLFPLAGQQTDFWNTDAHDYDDDDDGDDGDGGGG